jgi:hypothetical protein
LEIEIVFKFQIQRTFFILKVWNRKCGSDVQVINVDHGKFIVEDDNDKYANRNAG